MDPSTPDPTYIARMVAKLDQPPPTKLDPSTTPPGAPVPPAVWDLVIADLEAAGADLVVLLNGETAPMRSLNERPWALALAVAHARDRIGVERYQTRLRPWNGREFLSDYVAERADALAYLRGGLFEVDDEEVAQTLRRMYDNELRGFLRAVAVWARLVTPSEAPAAEPPPSEPGA